MSEMSELIERLEKATGPDWTIDRDISRAVFDVGRRTEPFKPGLAFEHDKKAYWVFGTEDTREGPKETKWGVFAKPFTESIDAALTLVPEGAVWLVRGPTRDDEGENTGKSLAHVEYNFAHAATPALALCIAALKAREALSQPLHHLSGGAR